MRIRYENDISEEDVELEGLVIASLEQVQNQKADNARKHPEHYVYHQEYVWLIRSSCCNTDAELELMWTELLQAETTNDLDWTYSSSQRYQSFEIFLCVEEISCLSWLSLLQLSSQYKNELCKHSLLLMETERLIDPLHDHWRQEEKGGEKRKFGHALERL
uniref:Uncharacterized protein n=1 Tax=Ditylenchus dipsaci TaxID=166011 RepID=A0A915EBK1_9BILA